MKKILIIGVGWEQIPLILKAKEKGLYVIATVWWEEKRIPADKVYKVDNRDLQAIDTIICTEHPDYITADESDAAMYAVAFFAEKYHFYGPKLSTQTITNNKFLQRECVVGTSVLQPTYKLCWNLEMAQGFAMQIGYPVMVKPIDNCGSIGVSKVRREDEFEALWLKAIENSYSRVCIIEKCIEGDVITADGFCDSEGFEFIATSSKDMYESNKNVAKVLYYPGKFSDTLVQTIKDNTEEVAKAIGIDFGFAHFEFIIEKNTQKLYLVEAANRGGGVFISDIILEEITGLDYASALLEMAMGEPVKLKCHQQYISKAMLYFLELRGKTEGHVAIENVSTHISAAYLGARQNLSGVQEKASAGREGVLLLKGQTFEEMSAAGKQFEQDACADVEEILVLVKEEKVVQV